MLPDGQLLYPAIREDSSQKLIRKILLMGRKDAVVLQKQEHKLYLPVGWTDLHATLYRSWHELHLVDQPTIKQFESLPAVEEFELPKLLLAGGGVASRELIKLSLAGLPVQVVAADNVEQLGEKVSQHAYAGLLLDLTSLPIEQFLACLQEKTRKCPANFCSLRCNRCYR